MNDVLSDADWALAERLNGPAPRYTSYPTAVQFREQVDRDALRRDYLEATGPLSLYVHLPFCEHLCWYCACATNVTRERADVGRYLDAIGRELGRYPRTDRLVRQVHLGGGTPNYLDPEEIARLGDLLRGAYPFSDDVEFGVELDPRTLTPEKAAAFRAMGANRASFGVQDTDPTVQRAIHREQPHELNLETAGMLRRLGFGSINIDLIYGLPRQTEESFRRTLCQVLEYDPDRLAVFSYAHVPWMRPAQKRFDVDGSLPESREKFRMLRAAVEVLTERGFVFIGMDHFAKPEDPLARALTGGTLGRNFQGYTTRSGVEIRAFGQTAISEAPRSYRQNAKRLESYLDAVESGTELIERGYFLSEDDLLRRRMIHTLMCHFELRFADFGEDFKSQFASELEEVRDLAKEGLCEIDGEGIAVLPVGRLLIRRVAMAFDRYTAPATGRHAKLV